jgi:UDP-GlcNAc:undecaprenyl-phosphate GlcNAc-1-phosphate transferase
VAAGWVILALSLWDIDFRIGGRTLGFGIVLFPFVWLFVVGVTNAINLSDGLDGLAAGLAFVSALALCAFGFQANAPLPFFLMLTLAGSLLGFLRFNSHPARVFMGDNGAYFIGFTLAFCCLLIARDDAPVSFSALMFVLGLPVYDTLSVAIRRMAEGRGPFSPDRKHLHHRLLDGVGLSHDQVVLSMYVLHIVLVLAGYLLARQDELLAGSLYVASMLGLEFAVGASSRVRRRSGRGAAAGRSRARSLHAALDVAAFGVIGALPVWSFLSADAIPRDFSLVAAVILVVSIALSTRRSHWRSMPGWVDRLALYVVGAFAVYLHTVQPRDVVSSMVMTAAFTMLVAWLVLKVLDTGDERLKVTSLDVLVVAATIGFASIGPWRIDAYAVEIVQVLVWFYAVEVLCLRLRRVELVHALPLLACSAILARALW